MIDTYRKTFADGSTKFMQVFTVNVIETHVYCIRTWWAENMEESTRSYTVGETTADGVLENLVEIIESYRRDGFRLVCCE